MQLHGEGALLHPVHWAQRRTFCLIVKLINMLEVRNNGLDSVVTIVGRRRDGKVLEVIYQRRQPPFHITKQAWL